MSAPAERSPGAYPRDANREVAAPPSLGAAPVSSSRRSPAPCVRELPDGARILAGNAGDHPLVLQLLVETQQAALTEDFQSRLDEPSYRPSDRLLVQRHKSLVAHVRLAHHIGCFDGQRVPLVQLHDLVSLPQYGQAEYDCHLLEAAESIATDEGAVLGVVHAERPAPFQSAGWSLIRAQGHTRASARGVLAHLDAQEAARRRRRRPAIEVRTWRHFELDAIRSIYDQATAPLWGALRRTEATWQWLVGRKAQDLMLVAVQRDAATDDEQIVGYAAMRGSCIVELMTLPDDGAARVHLVARACREAMDRDHQGISLYTPAADPLHELLVTAGGQWISDAVASGPRWLMRLFAPAKWGERFFTLWHERARVARIERPFDLGIDLGDERWRFTLTRRSARVAPTRDLPARWIRCDRPTMDSLLLGNLAPTAALTRGQMRLSDADLAVPLAAVFAPRLFWQSALEWMRL